MAATFPWGPIIAWCVGLVSPAVGRDGLAAADFDASDLSADGAHSALRRWRPGRIFCQRLGAGAMGR